MTTSLFPELTAVWQPLVGSEVWIDRTNLPARPGVIERIDQGGTDRPHWYYVRLENGDRELIQTNRQGFIRRA